MACEMIVLDRVVCYSDFIFFCSVFYSKLLAKFVESSVLILDTVSCILLIRQVLSC